MAAPGAHAYNSLMARKESRQARAARTEAIFERLAAANPTPKGELKYINPFTLLVAVVLSAQATDAGVNKATPALFAIADTPEKMAALGEERLAELIKTIGLYRTKARNLIALSRAIVERHGGETPGNREELEALPGVGRKTANVLLGHVFGQPGLVVDTHVRRLSLRLGLTRESNPDVIELEIQKLRPPEDWTSFSMRLILHGRRICHARAPKCHECRLRPDCPCIGVTLPKAVFDPA